MSRIDDDIVAKAAFYAGLSQVLSPDELPDDIRNNGNSLLRDVVNSVSADTEVDRGVTVLTVKLSKGNSIIGELSDVIPCNVVYNGEMLTQVSVEDFLTTYKDCKNVVCITVYPLRFFKSQYPGFDIDGLYEKNLYTKLPAGEYNIDSYKILTHLSNEEVYVIANKKLVIDDTDNFLKVICRNEVKAYIVDYLAYLLACMYQMATKEDCAQRMQLSLAHCKKQIIPHINVADPVLGMKNMRGQSPLLSRLRSNPELGW